MQNKYTSEEINQLLYKLDWIKILHEAIEGRKTSWNKDPVWEWRNASDEINGAVIRHLNKEINYDPWKKTRDSISSDRT